MRRTRWPDVVGRGRTTARTNSSPMLSSRHLTLPLSIFIWHFSASSESMSYCFRFPSFYFSQLDLFEIALVVMCVHAYEVCGCANRKAPEVASNAEFRRHEHSTRRETQPPSCKMFRGCVCVCGARSTVTVAAKPHHYFSTSLPLANRSMRWVLSTAFCRISRVRLPRRKRSVCKDHRSLRVYCHWSSTRCDATSTQSIE